MAKLNKRFYLKEHGYSDGDLEKELYERIESGESPEEILESDQRWPVYYHLSPKRENILNWYPFKEDCSILEVGSGLGALTGMLADVSKDLTSVELTEDRAKVNYIRHKDVDNLEIFVGNFENMNFGKKFDYIVLNGVLEYAVSFTDGPNPYETFLENIKKHLKPDGVVLIAIENRIGLKYFNGVPEDHTAQLFSGIDGYPYTTNVKTFTKKELKNLLRRAGFKYANFYYPNPDYKFPQVIYTDDSLSMVDNRVETDTFNVNRVRFFDESEVLRTFLSEGIADKFFNSFLVEASLEPPMREERVIFSKISDRRRPEYQTVTTIVEDQEGKRKVYKKPYSKKAKEHVERLVNYYLESSNTGRYVNVDLEEADDGVVFDYVSGRTLNNKLVDYLRQGKKYEFEREIENFADELYKDTELSSDYYTKEFKEMFGPEETDIPMYVKSGSNMDMIFTNIIESDKSYVIDYEWIIDFDLPQEFVIWRSLYYLYINELKGSEYGMPELMDLAGIDQSLHSTFLAWDEYFGNNHIRNDEDQVYKNRTVDALPFLNEMVGLKDINSSIYLDFGSGMSEENRIISEMKFDADNFEVSFDLTPVLERERKRLQKIRWDPLEKACAISDLEITTDSGDVNTYEFVNTSDQKILIDGTLYFLDDDPQVDLLGDYEGLTKISIKGKLVYINAMEALTVAKMMRLSMRALQSAVEEQRDTIYDLNTHIHNLEMQLKRLKGD